MKKQLFLLLLIAMTKIAVSQVTLEYIYSNASASGNSLLFLPIDSVDYKYIFFEPLNSRFTIYNLDHSVHLNVSIPITFAQGSSQYQIAFVSKSLFDCDTSNIEYALSLLGDGTPNSYPKHFYVYRTDGTQLTDIDSVCFLNYSDGWRYGPQYNLPIVSTPNGTKLILRHLDGSTRIYSICGKTSGIIENNDNNPLGNPYPNPTQDVITIPYSLPEKESARLKIYDLAGKEVKSFLIDGTFNSITVTTAELASGSYYYQLTTTNGQTGSKKLIKVN